MLDCETNSLNPSQSSAVYFVSTNASTSALFNSRLSAVAVLDSRLEAKRVFKLNGPSGEA